MGQFGVCGLCSFQVESKSSLLSQNVSCFEPSEAITHYFSDISNDLAMLGLCFSLREKLSGIASKYSGILGRKTTDCETQIWKSDNVQFGLYLTCANVILCCFVELSVI